MAFSLGQKVPQEEVIGFISLLPKEMSFRVGLLLGAK
jgi:hypothetical protein